MPNEITESLQLDQQELTPLSEARLDQILSEIRNASSENEARKILESYRDHAVLFGVKAMARTVGHMVGNNAIGGGTLELVAMKIPLDPTMRSLVVDAIQSEEKLGRLASHLMNEDPVKMVISSDPSYPKGSLDLDKSFSPKSESQLIQSK